MSKSNIIKCDVSKILEQTHKVVIINVIITNSIKYFNNVNSNKQ